jgi:uncharacterized protein YndB with AHSA1/START domain
MTSETVPTRPAPATLEIVNSRIFDAPREVVFGAFADPAVLARWWGPNGFTNTVEQFDLRPGGTWRIVMHSSDGTSYDNTAEFVEIVKPSRIVFDHLRPMHGYRMTMTYAVEPGGKTRLTWRMALEHSAEHERLQHFIFDANEQNFDRLATVLGTGL